MAWIQTATCPTCRQWVRGDARRCEKCDTVLVPPPPAGGRVTWPPPSADGRPVRKRTSEYALIFGIGGFLSSIILLGVPMAVAAIVLGFIAKRQIENSNGTFSGTGMATAGIILGALGIATLLVLLIVFRNGF